MEIFICILCLVLIAFVSSIAIMVTSAITFSMKMYKNKKKIDEFFSHMRRLSVMDTKSNDMVGYT